MINKEIELKAGQNLRYHGKGFKGYIKGLPYMIFVAYHGITKVRVKYNNTNVIVSRADAEAIN
jgi:hypothetical protein